MMALDSFSAIRYYPNGMRVWRVRHPTPITCKYLNTNKLTMSPAFRFPPPNLAEDGLTRPNIYIESVNCSVSFVLLNLVHP
jgi:hypothetical protein